MNNYEDRSIKFTTHAKERLQERNISEEDAIKVIQRGKPTGYREVGRIFSYYSIIVVFDDTKKDIYVITAYKLNRTLEQKIEEIPSPYEWIRKEDKEVFVNQAYYLLDKGIEVNEILEHLEALFKATCREYGEG